MATSSLSADRPLTDPSRDRLDYAPFAKQLANSILNTSPANGLVVALYGEWGTGKSTALNFLIHYLELHEEPPVIVRFNPWWFAGQADLVGRFFKQFAATIKKANLLKWDARKQLLAKSLGMFGAALSHAPVVSRLPLVGEGTKLLGQGVQAAGGLLEAADVVERKEQLEKALAEELSRIIVVIDDIDRLVPEEMRELFKLVKAVGDLPNVTYLLAFDRQLASDAMDRIHGTSGGQYLDKIIQVPFTLPMPDRGQLQQMLFDLLDPILEPTRDELFDKQEWGNIYLDGIDPFIQKPRDPVRLCNSLSVTYPAVRGEVRAVDFVALEVLRVFVPQVYDVIRGNPSMFTGTLSEYGRDRNAEEKSFHENWLSRVGVQKEAVQRMLMRLFPRLQELLSNTRHGDNRLQDWRRRLRVCSPEIFPIYFRFGLTAGEVAAEDIRNLIALSGDASSIINLLTSMANERRRDGRTRAGEMLLRLHDHAADIPRDNIRNVVLAIFSTGDDIVAADTRERGVLDFGDDMRIRWLLRRLLKRLPLNERASVLSAAIMLDGRAVVTIAREIVGYARQHDADAKKNQPEDLIVRAEDVADLEAIARNRIRDTVQSGDMWTHAKPRMILDALCLWGDSNIAQQLVANRVQDDGLMLDFLRLFIGRLRSHSLGDRVAHTSIHLDPLDLWSLVDVDQLERRVRAIRLDELTDERRACADAFLRGCVARRAGKQPGWERGLSEDSDD